jgi:DNA replication and repair protein RecF
MIIQNIRISNFRNFKRKTFSFSPETTVIVGPNTSGKTNIFEAIFLLATGKSFKAQIEEEMISYGQEIARVNGEFTKPSLKLEIVLTRGEITIGEDPEKTERVPRKRLLHNSLGKRLIDFAGSFKAVLFGPWDLELVTESPTVRRKFLDTLLSQVDREYRRASLSYEKGLRQRNRLLYRIREEGVSRTQLLFWDRLLIKNGDYISQMRQEFIEFANAKGKIDDQDFSLDYDKSAISEARLEQYAEEEVAAATTLVGPHRDDFCFRLKKNKRERDLSRYGSRGEQRMGILWLKFAELAYIEQKTDEKPTLLLDDIFSELDHEHREVVMKTVGRQQTIITTADPHFVRNLKRVEKIELKV